MPGRLYAISDLHVDRAANWQALQELPPHPDDWLIVAGDVSSHSGRFARAMALLARRFARVFWTPGNHDLWTHPDESPHNRGVFKYNLLVAVCRELGVLTPEDPYVTWPGEAQQPWIALTFTLFDYSFGLPNQTAEEAVAWARQIGIVSNDEYLLHADPFPDRAGWCRARARYTARRLLHAAQERPLLLVNHYPLVRELALLPALPRFEIWSGSALTAAWPTDLPVAAVVYGHLHRRGRREWAGIPHLEVSLGYPGQYDAELGVGGYLQRLDDLL